MATEPQLAALRNWLKQEMPKGEAVCEMPGEVCSDALSRLHEASEKFKEDKKTNYGLALKTKKEIVKELQEQGWIGVPISEGEEKEKKVEKASELPKKPDEKEVFGDRAQAEAEKIRDEQGLTQVAPEQEMVTITITQELPTSLGTDGKTYELKPGLVRIPKENAEALIKRGAATKEGEEPPQQPKVTELIAKFVDILAQVSEVVRNEDRIPKQEKGYATNWAANAVKDALEKEGKDEEEVGC